MWLAFFPSRPFAAVCSMAQREVVRDDGVEPLFCPASLSAFLPPKVYEKEQAPGQYWGRLALPYKEMLQGEQIVNQPWPRIPSQPGSASSVKQMAVWLCGERKRERDTDTHTHTHTVTLCPSLPLGSIQRARRQLPGAFERVKRCLSSG